MRRFTDRDGTHWDVVLGRESWGTSVALFVPVSEGSVRQTPLHAVSYDAAARELNELDSAGLQGLLDRSQMKPEG